MLAAGGEVADSEEDGELGGGLGGAVTVTVLVDGTTAGGAAVTGGGPGAVSRTVADGTRTDADGLRIADGLVRPGSTGADVFGPGACLAASAARNRAWPPVAMATVIRIRQAASTPYRPRRQLAPVVRTPGRCTRLGICLLEGCILLSYRSVLGKPVVAEGVPG